MKRFLLAQLASFGAVFFAVLLTGGTLLTGTGSLIGIALIIVIVVVLALAIFLVSAILTSEAMEVKQAMPIAIVTVVLAFLVIIFMMGWGYEWLKPVLAPLGDATIGWIIVAFIGGLLSYWWQTPERSAQPHQQHTAVHTTAGPRF